LTKVTESPNPFLIRRGRGTKIALPIRKIRSQRLDNSQGPWEPREVTREVKGDVRTDVEGMEIAAD
jgi:hypothetical protein